MTMRCLQPVEVAVVTPKSNAKDAATANHNRSFVAFVFRHDGSIIRKDAIVSNRYLAPREARHDIRLRRFKTRRLLPPELNVLATGKRPPPPNQHALDRLRKRTLDSRSYRKPLLRLQTGNQSFQKSLHTPFVPMPYILICRSSEIGIDRFTHTVLNIRLSSSAFQHNRGSESNIL